MKLTDKLNAPMNEKQLAKLQARWKRMSHRGLALHTLGMGSALFLWMCVCYFGFMYFSGHLRLVREPLVLYSALLCFLLLASVAPIGQYWTIKRMASHFPPTEA